MVSSKNDKEGVTLKRSLIKTVYQIVQTPSVDGQQGTVYSILGLYSDGLIIRSRFVYDVARNLSSANQILKAVNNFHPEKDELLDFVAELI